MQISGRGNVLQGWRWGEDVSCCSSQFLGCSWIVEQSWRSPVLHCCQFAQLLPLAARSPVVQAWSGEIFPELFSCTPVAFTSRVCELGPLAAFFSKQPQRLQCSCFASKSPWLLLVGDICTGVGESDGKRQNNFFGNLEGSQGCAGAQPRQNAATAQRGHSLQLGSCQAGL